MKIRFDSYARDEKIPAQDHIRNRKLAKYFNREAAAAVICAYGLFAGAPPPPDTPFYYETGMLEFEEYGLDAIVAASLDEQGNYSQRLYIEKGIKAVMPLTQFKALYNMPLSLVSIEFGFTGDNAVLYGSARGLLTQALHAPRDTGILLGCGKAGKGGAVETAFALVDKEELRDSPFLAGDCEGIEMFRAWRDGGGS